MLKIHLKSLDNYLPLSIAFEKRDLWLSEKRLD